LKPVFIECEYTLLKKGNLSSAEKDFTFHDNCDGKSLEAIISYINHNIIVRVEGAVLPEKFIDELAKLSRFDGDKVSEDCRELLNNIFGEAKKFTHRILSLIKYHLDHFDIDEVLFSIKSEKWGVNKSELNELPISISASISTHSVCPLRQDTAEYIKSSIQNKVEPLLAMRHLHRAKSGSSPHHMWIEATVAAELAIKEVISRAKPDLEVLLLEMPSPPLAKLYGSILKEYLGEDSPYRKSIIKGVEYRNKLVHRHDSPTIKHQEAINYVKDVERAIFHLLSLLYPEDELISQKYTRARL